MAKPRKTSIELWKKHEARVTHDVLESLIDEHHPHLSDARIALGFRRNIKPTPEGHLILSSIHLATELFRALMPIDFVILFNPDTWANFDDTQQRALIDHELCHAARAETKYGEPIEDDQGRPVWRTRRHDIEEFHCIAERYGLWKKDLEEFAAAAARKKDAPLLEGAE